MDNLDLDTELEAPTSLREVLKLDEPVSEPILFFFAHFLDQTSEDRAAGNSPAMLKWLLKHLENADNPILRARLALEIAQRNVQLALAATDDLGAGSAALLGSS